MVTLQVTKQETVTINNKTQAVNFIQAYSNYKQIKKLSELKELTVIKQVCDLFDIQLEQFRLVGEELAISKGDKNATYFKHFPHLAEGLEHAPVLCLINSQGYDVLTTKDILTNNEIIPLVHMSMVLNPNNPNGDTAEVESIFRLLNNNQFVVLLCEDEYIAEYYQQLLVPILDNVYIESAMFLAEVDESAEDTDIKVLKNFKNEKYGDLTRLTSSIPSPELFE